MLRRGRHLRQRNMESRGAANHGTGVGTRPLRQARLCACPLVRSTARAECTLRPGAERASSKQGGALAVTVAAPAGTNDGATPRFVVQRTEAEACAIAAAAAAPGLISPARAVILPDLARVPEADAQSGFGVVTVEAFGAADAVALPVAG